MTDHELAILVAAAKLLRREGYIALSDTVESVAKASFNARSN